MRWPWQRDREETPEAAAGSGAAGSAAAGSPGAGHVGEPVSPAGWAHLAPLQRTIGVPATTIGAGSFVQRLPAWSDPSFLGELNHALGSEAPTGTIDVDGGGIAPMVSAHTPELPLAPRESSARVQRQAVAAAARRPVESRPLTSAAGTGPEPRAVPTVTGDSGGVGAPASSTSDSGSADSAHPSSSSSSAEADPELPALVLQRTPSESPRETPPQLPEVHDAVRTDDATFVSIPMPTASSPGRGPAAGANAEAGDAVNSAESPGRRLGLGAPLRMVGDGFGSPSAPVQRSAGSEGGGARLRPRSALPEPAAPHPAPPTARPSVGASPASGGASVQRTVDGADGGSSGSSSAELLTAPPAPTLPLLAASERTGVRGGLEPLDGFVPAEDPGGVGAASAAWPTVDLVPARPLSSSLAPDRFHTAPVGSTATSASTTSAASTGTATGAAPAVQRATTSGGTISRATAVSRPGGPSVPAGSAAPAMASGNSGVGGFAPPAPAVHRVGATTLPVVQRAPASEHEPAGVFGGDSGRSTAVGGSASRASVQRVLEPDAADLITPGETAAAPTTETAPAGAPQGAGLENAVDPMGADRIDELAAKLMPPLLRRIRADLLRERERRGIRMDAL